MLEVRRTAEFVDWILGLRDVAARARIAKRIDRIVLGNFGDAEAIGEGVSELRFRSDRATGSITPGAAMSW